MIKTYTNDPSEDELTHPREVSMKSSLQVVLAAIAERLGEPKEVVAALSKLDFIDRKKSMSA